MKLIEVHDAQAWERFQTAGSFAQFVQSWAWGEFRRASGQTVRRFALAGDDGVWQIAVQIEYRPRKFGMGYWFAGRGPIFAPSVTGTARRDALYALCEELLKIRELRQRTLFWRMEPLSELTKPEGLLPLRFRRTSAMNPASTVLVDLGPRKPEDLLASMHEKTRYNIRLAERKGVRTRLASSPADLARFLELMDETAARDRFVQHEHTYLRKTYEHLKATNMGGIRVAEFEGKILAANLEVWYGDTATYFYGASSSENRNVMAPYLLHWDAMREACNKGLKLYDFWGANPPSKAMFYYKPSWEGITRHKLSYGGRVIDLVGTWDLPMNTYLYRLAFLKGFFRG
jgi:peptidoglycan pentaglycine glycine transferase (the first glycine)